MKRFFITVFYFLLFFSSHASEISGYITDCKDNTPLIGVNIKVIGCAYGTVTNNMGYFRLVIPANCNGKTLKISYLGYKSFELKMDEYTVMPIQHFCMKEDPVTLAVITVFPDNTLLTLLNDAYKNIPKNYPDFPTTFQGFYREGLKMKDGPILEFSEAIINGYKTSYSIKTIGQISIEKSRKNIFPSRDTINLVKFYGGPFFPHTYDIVHSRKEFIQPSNFKDYKYSIESEVLYDGKPAYKIRFAPKNDHSGVAKGTFLIDKKTLAYIRFDYNLTERGITQRMLGSLAPLKQLSSRKSVSYYNYNNKWYLNSIYSASEYKNTRSGKLLETTDDFVTTSVEFDDVKPIPFEKQLRFTEIFSDVATEYSVSFWKDYTILEQGKTKDADSKLQYSVTDSEKILSKTYQTTKSIKDYAIAIIRRFYFDFGFNYSTIKFPVDNYALNYALNNGNHHQYSGKGFQSFESFRFTMLTGFKLNRYWSVYYDEQYRLGTQSYFTKDNAYGIIRTICLKQGGKQFFLEPRIAYYRKFYGINGGEYENSDKNLEIEGHRFNAKKIAFYSGNQDQGIRAGFMLKTGISKRLNIILGGSYDLSLSLSPKLYIAEQNGLFRRKVFQSLENNSVNYQENGKQTSTSSFFIPDWSVSTGLRFDF